MYACTHVLISVKLMCHSAGGVTYHHQTQHTLYSLIMHQLHSVGMKPALAPESSLLFCAVAEVNACPVAGEIEEP